MATLHIIGNGFDLHHGMPTRYKDFKNWTRRQKGGSDLFFLSEAFNDQELWCDFEGELGRLDLVRYVEVVLADYREEDIDAQNTKTTDYVTILFKEAFERTLNLFREWGKMLNEKMPQPDAEINQYGLDANDEFFTFNYTETLENVYSVPAKAVKHIHGSSSDKMENIVVGHNVDYEKKRKIWTKGVDECLGVNADIVSEIIPALNKFRKDTAKTIAQNQEYFDGLARKGITDVVVLGCSYGDVDFPYFEEIRKQLPNAKWTFGYYDGSAKSKASQYIRNLGLNNYAFTEF